MYNSMENDEEEEKVEELIKEEEQKNHKIQILMCPECKSNNVTYYLEPIPVDLLHAM